tara:strand:+ start:604 stop:1356 length:753 start_codon:yes stop_codon:yes gene_type:complete
MNKGSIVISQDHIAGEIILEKDHDNSIIIKESNISSIIRNNKPRLIEYTDYMEIVNKIKQIVGSMCFSSRYSGMDMYDNKYYDNYDPNFTSNYILGIESLYNKPNGDVFYHIYNTILFECTNIEFIMMENIISFKYTNIDINKIYLIKRSSGDIQNTCIINNGGIFFDKGVLKIQNEFASNKDDINDLKKTIDLESFLELNNIKLEIHLPYFTENIIDNYKDNILIQLLLLYYNDKLKHYSNKIKQYIKK